MMAFMRSISTGRTVEGEDVGLMCRQAVVDGDFATAGFVEHGHFCAVAETAWAVDKNRVDIFDKSVVADGVVGDIVFDVFDVAVVANGDIMEGGVAQSGVLANATG
jgi:hypothetical protein